MNFRSLKKGVKEFNRNFVGAPADNVVIVWIMYCINTLKQELSTAKTYEHINMLDEKSVVDGHQWHMAT